MGLIFLGAVALFVGLTLGKNNPLSKFKGMITILGIVVLLIGLLTQSVRTIDAGKVGVQKLFGKVLDEVKYEGIHVINPLVELVIIDIRTQNYSMVAKGEDTNVGNDAIPVLTKDGLQVIIDLTVLYRVTATDAPNIIRTIGVDFEAKIIRPIIRSEIRDNAANYDAIELYAEFREQFENNLRDAIKTDLLSRGFELEQLLIRKINLPESVKQSIERKITADQEAQRMQYVLAKEKQEAERRRVEAQGIADAQKIINSGLSDKLLKFEYIKVQKELVNSPNAKIILLGDSKNSPPFIIGK